MLARCPREMDGRRSSLQRSKQLAHRTLVSRHLAEGVRSRADRELSGVPEQCTPTGRRTDCRQDCGESMYQGGVRAPRGGSALRRSDSHPCVRSGHSHPLPPIPLITSLLRYIVTSLHHYFLTRCGAAFPAPATLFHPWHANASANTFSLICTGAKRLRAPSAFRRTPPSHSRRTIHIVGSKLAQGTVK